ncbi:hypothetical protein SAMN05414138_10219 [Rhodoplanes sp. JGI PP 4-B12]|uniref:hypothetical protein n=1 Tax=Rhodoplanes sp. JGI PP 4-B12 TaxID=1873883 RepID=UPI000B50B8CD|nr:hypothetical protein [Rhodoplanes sp. JGI PP 4-B12]SNB54310.1 hypothetical protein SAMN05414138_10219 [Rhodoplanes sp. JGI PP 4-B12]
MSIAQIAEDGLEPQSRAVDHLAQAIDYVRPKLERTGPITERARTFWAAVRAARKLAATDVIHDEFRQLAIDTGLFADLGDHPPYAAGETIEHLIRWGLFARNPFR